MNNIQRCLKILREDKKPTYLKYRDISLLTKTKQFQQEKEKEILEVLKSEVKSVVLSILKTTNLKNRTVAFDDGMSTSIEISDNNRTTYEIFDDGGVIKRVDRTQVHHNISQLPWIKKLVQVIDEYKTIGISGVNFTIEL